ncbi:MAG TPA: DUF481 domain-containing protein [Hyphomonas sp.]|nr:DUF481 domain-containing protein [Hyphomonas sp.]
MRNIALLAACAAVVLAAPAALAENDEPVDGWSGEGALSAGMTRGNTNTSDVGVKFDLDRAAGAWTVGLQGEADYGKQDGLETRNRAFAAIDLDHEMTESFFSFGRVSYEVDQFTGFDSRSFVGGGVGYRLPEDGAIEWVVRGGPGVKIDELKRVITVDDMGAALIIPATRETSLGAVATSKFGWQINDKVKLSENAGVVYAKESTQFTNGVALTAALNGSLSARVSFDTRYDTNPPHGFESTDSASKIALVYTLGK